MNAFDKVIGYKATKRELLQVCDMLRNREIYEEMGARLPHGLLLYGDRAWARRFWQGALWRRVGCTPSRYAATRAATPLSMELHRPLPARRQKHRPLSFWTTWTKFANEDDTHCDAPEYAAVQAGIDYVKDAGVFVIATANDIRKLPSSLRRSGRFDRKIGLQAPTASRRGGDHHPLSENETGFGQCQHGRPDEDDAL